MTRTNRIRYSLFLLLLVCLVNEHFSQVVSPFNNQTIGKTAGDYSFIVSGHFHGASTNRSSFPASSLLANIDTLNALNPLFLVSLGDLFIDVNETYINNYQRSLFNKLKMPLFNVVGNHDVSNGNMYKKIYGETFFTFGIGTELYIFLDTEMNDGDLKGRQLDFFRNAIARADNPEIKNIFIFSHRPVWATQKKYAHLFKGNTRAVFESKNFQNEILPLLTSISGRKNIVWISGSMGNGAASFFYDKDQTTNITYMQTAIRDLPRDAVLNVKVTEGKISFQGISFLDQKTEPVESYNPEFWNTSQPPEQQFSMRLLPYLILKTVKHLYFWEGFAFAVLLLIFIYVFVVKKWKRSGSSFYTRK